MTCLKILALTLIALAAFICAVWAVLVVQQKIAVARFLREFGGQWLLVCTRRHDWFDFIRNNVEPVLPEDIRLVWTELKLREAKSDDPAILLRAVGATGERPFLFHVDSRRTVPIHDELLRLRSNGKRDAVVQEQVRVLLGQACERS